MPHRKDPEAIPMKVITINVPQSHVDFFKKVVKYGLYPSRSEAMRSCINLAMPNIIKDLLEVERIIAMDSLPTMIDFMETRGYTFIKNGKYKPGRHTKKIPLGNCMWEDLKLKSGEVVRVPKDMPEEPIRDFKTIKIVRVPR